MIPGQNFNDRLKAQKEAKLAMLKRAKEKQMDPAEKARLLEERAKRNACLLYTSPSPRDRG